MEYVGFPGRAWRLAIAATAALFVAVGCSSESESSTEVSEPSSATAAQPADDSATGAAAADGPVDEVSDASVTEDDLARFIAAAEEVVVGTSYESVIIEDPDLYIGVAQTMCAGLADDQSIDEVVDEYLADSGIVSPSSEDNAFAGALLGAGVETLCPEFGSNI